MSPEDVIEGRGWPGGWSDHVGSWLESGVNMRDSYWRTHFEDLAVNPEPFLRQIRDVTSLPLAETGETFPSFEYWHELAPKFYRSGRSDEWDENVSLPQKALIWALHGRVMTMLGYTMSFASRGGGCAAEIAELEALGDGLWANVERIANRRGHRSSGEGERVLQENLLKAYRDLKAKQGGIEWPEGELAGKRRVVAYLEEELRRAQASNLPESTSWSSILADISRLIRRIAGRGTNAG